MNKAQNMVFNILQHKDPRTASILKQCIDNGESPQQVMQQLIEAGKINQYDVQKIRNNLGMINRFTGMRLTNQDVDKLDQMFNQQNSNSNSFRF